MSMPKVTPTVHVEDVYDVTTPSMPANIALPLRAIRDARAQMAEAQQRLVSAEEDLKQTLMRDYNGFGLSINYRQVAKLGR